MGVEVYKHEPRIHCISRIYLRRTTINTGLSAVKSRVFGDSALAKGCVLSVVIFVFFRVPH